MSEELNNHRPYTAAELSNLLHNERAERAEEVNALAVAVGLERVHEAGSILAAVEKLAADALSRPAPAVQVPDDGYSEALFALQEVGSRLGFPPGMNVVTQLPGCVDRILRENNRRYPELVLRECVSIIGTVAGLLADDCKTEDGWECYEDEHKRLRASQAALNDLLAPTPATMATEAVAQGGGVDVEKVMAMVDQFGQEKWNQGDNQYRRGCESSATYYSEEAGRIRDRIRALLASAPAAPVGDGFISAGVVINNNQPGSQYIVEAPHGVTIPVGTEVFIK